jgi:hypothetical protein
VQERRADLDRLHAKFGRQEAGERDLQLRVGQEEDRLAVQPLAILLERALGAFAAGRDDAAEVHLVHAERVRRGVQPGGGAFGSEREGGGKADRVARFERPAGVAEEGLGEQVAGVWADRRHCAGATAGQPADRDAELVEQAGKLVLDDVGKGADDKQLGLTRLGARAEARRPCGQAGILAFGEGGLDAAAE